MILIKTIDKRIEYLSMPDFLNRCQFFLCWMDDYHPGHPEGEHVVRERGQIYFTDPRKRGFPLPTEDQIRNNLYM